MHASPLAAQVVELQPAGAQLVSEQCLRRLVRKHARAPQQERQHRLMVQWKRESAPGSSNVRNHADMCTGTEHTEDMWPLNWLTSRLCRVWTQGRTSALYRRPSQSAAMGAASGCPLIAHVDHFVCLHMKQFSHTNVLLPVCRDHRGEHKADRSIGHRRITPSWSAASAPTVPSAGPAEAGGRRWSRWLHHRACCVCCPPARTPRIVAAGRPFASRRCRRQAPWLCGCPWCAVICRKVQGAMRRCRGGPTPPTGGAATS